MIYLNFEDLNEEKQEELIATARKHLASEISKKDAEIQNMDLDDLINEKIDNKLRTYDFVFNI